MKMFKFGVLLFILTGVYCAWQNDAHPGPADDYRQDLEIHKLRCRVDSLSQPVNYVHIRFGRPGDLYEQPFKLARIFLPALKVYGFECVAGGAVEYWLFKTRLKPSVSDSLLGVLGLETKK